MDSGLEIDIYTEITEQNYKKRIYNQPKTKGIGYFSIVYRSCISIFREVINSIPAYIRKVKFWEFLNKVYVCLKVNEAITIYIVSNISI